MAVLVDTSVWIEAQNPRRPEYSQLRQLLLSDEEVCYAYPIQVEFCQGLRVPELFQRAWDSFLSLRLLAIEHRHWETSARNYFMARKKGVTTQTLDCLIATLAAEYRVPVWAKDRGFERMAPIAGCRLHPAS